VVTKPGHPGDDVPAGTLSRFKRRRDWRKNNTTGRTFEETERNIREATEGPLKTLGEFGDPVPQPASVARDIEIQPAA
jgi:hypothetical protein